MLNQVIIVGRVVDAPKVIETEEERTICKITLAVQRTYKNADGVYDTDFITCTLWDGLASKCTEFVCKGDLVGVKGRLQTDNVANEDGTVTPHINVIAEKISYLSSCKNDDNTGE